MSCATSRWKAYQNTSGHCNIVASPATTAGVDCQFHLPMVNVARPSSFEGCRLLWAGLWMIGSGERVVFTWVVLGFFCRVPELNVKVHAEDGVAVVIPRNCGERWDRAGLDKGLTKVLYLLTGIPAFDFCLAFFSLLYKDSARMNQCHGLVPAYPELSTVNHTALTRIPEENQQKSNVSHNKEKTDGLLWCNVSANVAATQHGAKVPAHENTQTVHRPEIACFLLQWLHTAQNTISQALLLKVDWQGKDRK